MTHTQDKKKKKKENQTQEQVKAWKWEKDGSFRKEMKEHTCIFKNSSLLMVLQRNGPKDWNKNGNAERGGSRSEQLGQGKKTENRLERVFQSLAYRVELLEANTEPMTEKKSVSVSEWAEKASLKNEAQTRRERKREVQKWRVVIKTSESCFSGWMRERKWVRHKRKEKEALTQREENGAPRPRVHSFFCAFIYWTKNTTCTIR